MFNAKTLSGASYDKLHTVPTNCKVYTGICFLMPVASQFIGKGNGPLGGGAKMGLMIF